MQKKLISLFAIIVSTFIFMGASAPGCLQPVEEGELLFLEIRDYVRAAEPGGNSYSELDFFAAVPYTLQHISLLAEGGPQEPLSTWEIERVILMKMGTLFGEARMADPDVSYNWPFIEIELDAPLFQPPVNTCSLETHTEEHAEHGFLKLIVLDVQAVDETGAPMKFKSVGISTGWFQVVEPLELVYSDTWSEVDAIYVDIEFNREANLGVYCGPPEDPLRDYHYPTPSYDLKYYFAIVDLEPGTEYVLTFDAWGYDGGSLEWEADEITLPEELPIP